MNPGAVFKFLFYAWSVLPRECDVVLHIAAHRDHGFHRIMNENSSGTGTRFQSDREQFRALGGIVMTMPCRHR